MQDSHLQPSAAIKDSFLIQRMSIQKPNLVGVFSSEKLSETGIRLDASNCKYFKKQLLAERNCMIDLKVYDDLCKEYENKCSESAPTYQPMTSFLEYLEELVTQEKFIKCNKNKLFHEDIICHMRVLIQMIMIHGDPYQSFTLLCTKYKGNIYICRQIKPQENRDEHMKMVAGHVSYSDNPHTDVNSSVSGITKFHCVFNWKLNDSNIMYFSGVQGVDSDAEILPETDLSKVKIARIKTKFQDADERVFAKYKSPYWWSRSFLLGNTEIHVANINKDDVITNIDTIGLDTFLHDNEEHWKKSSSERLSFLNLFIDLIKLRMKFVNCPLTVYEFDFNPKSRKNVFYKPHNGQNVFTFLSDKYINVIKDL